MRVAFIVPHLRTPSGWRSLATGLIRALEESAEVIPVVFVSESDVGAARNLFPDCERRALPFTQFLSLRDPSDWLRVVRTWSRTHFEALPKIDLVHSLEAYPSGLVGHWLAGRLGVPHVLTAAGTYAIVWDRFRLHRPLYRRVLRRAACVCPISHGTAELMERHFAEDLRHTSSRVVMLGSNFSKEVPAEFAERSCSVKPMVLSVGEVKARKGYHHSLIAFAKLKEFLPAAHYVIIGHFSQDSYFAKLTEIIADRQLCDVQFLGAVSDDTLRRRFREASVFMLTPQQQGHDFEGFGLVYLEAGAYGLPVVASRTGGVPDAVKEGVTGFLLEPEDTDGIATALHSLLTDHELAHRMGQANRQWSETLTWERYAKEQLKVYREVTSPRGEGQLLP